MAITDADIAELATLLDKGRDDWIHGRLQWEEGDSVIEQAEDATIFGPFGGIAPSGSTPKVRPDVQRQIASHFRGGSGSTELVRAIVEGDLAVVVYVDRSTVRFEGSDDEGPWILRVTEVFRKQDGKWIRLHRHADPLVRYRDLDSTRLLLD
jgi:ketosteroid isomerase-like protein